VPFKSEKQRRWMWANDPEMAKKWEEEEDNEKIKETSTIQLTQQQLRNIIRETLLNEKK
jgi:hypothetical protein